MMATKEGLLAWDNFLAEDDRQGVEAFRVFAWKAMQRQLASDFEPRLGARDENEPHWVTAGQAMFWQWQEQTERWEQVGPLPANTAGLIHHTLQNGLRLRPNVEPFEAAVPSEGLQGDAEELPVRYTCARHGEGPCKFRAWRDYVDHLRHYREVPEYDPPADVARRARTYLYYCLMSGTGFRSERDAKIHLRHCLASVGKPVHATVDQMRMGDGGADQGGADQGGARGDAGRTGRTGSGPSGSVGRTKKDVNV